MRKKRKFNTYLSVIDYAMMVEELVNEFYNLETGAYQPQFGNLNAMRLFYNHFYKTKDEEKILDALDMDVIVSDDDFIDAFNNAITSCTGIQYDFANAYRDALDIVEEKKTSVGRVIDVLRAGLKTFFETSAPAMSEESIDKIYSLVQNIADGKIGVEEIMKTYGKKSNVPDLNDKPIQKDGKVVTMDKHLKK